MKFIIIYIILFNKLMYLLYLPYLRPKHITHLIPIHRSDVVISLALPQTICLATTFLLAPSLNYHCR